MHARKPHVFVPLLIAALCGVGSVAAQGAPVTTEIDQEAAERDARGGSVALLERADGTRVYDHRRLGESLHEADIAAARDLALLIGLSQDGSELRQGLLALAEDAPERFALRSGVAPGSNFFRRGGTGFYITGRSGRPESRLESYLRRLDGNDLGAEIDAALLDFSPRDISHGNRIETTVKTYRVKTEVRSYSVVLSDVFTENITAQRIFGRGPGSGGVVSTNNYPLELPTLGVRGVSTTAVSPASLSIGGGGLAGEQDVAKRHFASRYPPVAFNMYQQAMDALAEAYPETDFIWTTVPLRESDNLQRNIFNALVRMHCEEHDYWLYDLAAIEAHDSAGEPVGDAQGPVIAEEWRGDRDGELGRDGRLRLARVWWRLLVGLSDQRG